MNIVKSLIARIEEDRIGTKTPPCKNYGSEAACERATAEMADKVGRYFTRTSADHHSARYVVFYVESWGRWVGGIDLTEVLGRSTSTGGYLGVAKGFYTF